MQQGNFINELKIVNLTIRLHTDRIKVVGWDQEILAAGEAGRYAACVVGGGNV